MIQEGVCYGQQLHVIDAQINHKEMLRLSVVPFIHNITSCCSIIIHGQMLEEFLHGQRPNQTRHPWSMLVEDRWIRRVFQLLPTTNFTHPRSVDQLWSDQTPTGLLPPQSRTPTHFQVVFYCGQLDAHLCNNPAVHSITHHLWDGCIISAKKSSLTQIKTNVWTIFELLVFIEKVFSSLKLGAQTKVLDLYFSCNKDTNNVKM